MGVPAFFRWLSTKYPKIVSKVMEEDATTIAGETIPVDISKPNPNGEEFDNLYLDMNNIIHPCFHPEGKPAPESEEQIMQDIFKYIERLVNMVRPRKMLFMAVDGVAPRAKMNQQRSRRFRSAQEAEEEVEKKLEFQKLLVATGKAEPGSAPSDENVLDSNVITPGTPFMHRLSEALKYWVAYKLNKDPAWANLKVMISDASVPGEGEHKMMEFIRSQRRSPEHDPNTRHVIYGLDADLIMLGLATHEPHFRILREDVFQQEGKERRCHLCNQKGHIASECTGEIKEKVGEFDEKEKVVEKKPYVWLHISVLREYLETELHVPNQGFKYDLERAIDDYVFLCFFVGNDFLPHLPSLSIREEGIDTLIAVWKDVLPMVGGYVTKDGEVDLQKAQYILDGLAKQEDLIFKKRREIDVRRERNAKRRKQEQEQRNNRNSGNNTPQNQLSRNNSRRKQDTPVENEVLFAPGAFTTREVSDQTEQIYANRKEIFQAQVQDANLANKSAAAVLKETLLRKKSSSSLLQQATDNGNAEIAPDTPPSVLKRKAEALDDEEEEGTPGRNTPIPKTKGNSDEMPPDDVRLWEDGYADRYYERKFGVDPSDREFRHKVAAAYVEGVCWVLLYYMQGCASWSWFYPYHYAPFAADFVDMVKAKPKFEVGTPFHPYEQLMAVLPAASNHAIPEPYRSLMEEDDSPIIDFYPTDFALDLNGKKFKWQGVALLPFIDENRLLTAMKSRASMLTEDEVERNEFGKDLLLFSTKHPMYRDVLTNFYSKSQGAPVFKLNPQTTHGLTGKIEKIESFLPGSPLIYPNEAKTMPDLSEDQSMSVFYAMPISTNVHKSQLLRGVEMPTPKLTSFDRDQQLNRSRNNGRNQYDNRQSNDNYRQGNNNNGGGRINYTNPIAQHLDPRFVAGQHGQFPPPPPQFSGGQIPPPHVLAQMGIAMPPGFPPLPQQPQQYQGGQNGYHGQQGGGYQNHYPAQNQSGGGRNGYQGQQYGRGRGYGGDRGGRGGYDGQSYGNGGGRRY